MCTGRDPAEASAGQTVYCGHCGGAAERTGAPGPAHDGCAHRLAMEPPRYCRSCRRRMKVQVKPFGWTAECSRHGIVAS